MGYNIKSVNTMHTKKCFSLKELVIPLPFNRSNLINIEHVIKKESLFVCDLYYKHKFKDNPKEAKVMT